VKHGISKLDEALDYLEATSGVPLAPAKIRAEKLVLRVPEGKSVRKVPFGEATVEELRAATRAAGDRPGARPEPAIVRWIRKALRGGGLRAVSVRLRGGVLQLGGIRPERVVQVGRALAKARLPKELL